MEKDEKKHRQSNDQTLMIFNFSFQGSVFAFVF